MEVEEDTRELATGAVVVSSKLHLKQIRKESASNSRYIGVVPSKHQQSWGVGLKSSLILGPHLPAPVAPPAPPRELSTRTPGCAAVRPLSDPAARTKGQDQLRLLQGRSTPPALSPSSRRARPREVRTRRGHNRKWRCLINSF